MIMLDEDGCSKFATLYDGDMVNHGGDHADVDDHGDGYDDDCDADDASYDVNDSVDDGRISDDNADCHVDDQLVVDWHIVVAVMVMTI